MKLDLSLLVQLQSAAEYLQHCYEIPQTLPQLPLPDESFVTQWQEARGKAVLDFMSDDAAEYGTLEDWILFQEDYRKDFKDRGAKTLTAKNKNIPNIPILSQAVMPYFRLRNAAKPEYVIIDSRTICIPKLYAKKR